MDYHEIYQRRRVQNLRLSSLTSAKNELRKEQLILWRIEIVGLWMLWYDSTMYKLRRFSWIPAFVIVTSSTFMYSISQKRIQINSAFMGDIECYCDNSAILCQDVILWQVSSISFHFSWHVCKPSVKHAIHQHVVV